MWPAVYPSSLATDNIHTFYFGKTNNYIDQGTSLNYNGLFNKAVYKQVNQARRGMFNLATKARKLSLPIYIQCELFDQFVMPILIL